MHITTNYVYGFISIIEKQKMFEDKLIRNLKLIQNDKSLTVFEIQ